MTDIESKGKCQILDPAARTFTIKEVDGTINPFKWVAGPLDDVMKKWKVGFYLTVKYDPDTRTVKNVTYWQEGKDQFPKQQGGGKQYVPKNEKPMIFESVLKTCSDAFIQDAGKAISYEKKMEAIWSVAKKISLEIIKESGA